MPTVSYDIANANDNGWQDAGAWAPTFVFIGANPSNAVHAGWRWQAVAVPNGATITSATLQIRARGSVTGTITNVHAKVRAHKGDAPAFAEGSFEPDVNFTATTAGVDYDPSAWVDGDYYNITITSVIQEVVNDGSWASGNDLAVVAFDDGSTLNNFVRLYAFDDGDVTANRITIDYTTGAGALGVNLGEAVIGGSLF